MGIHDRAAWGVILGLSLMIVGGLMLWAYAARRHAKAPVGGFTGPEAAAAQFFHLKLARWFFLYGIAITIVGIVFILWASSILF